MPVGTYYTTHEIALFSGLEYIRSGSFTMPISQHSNLLQRAGPDATMSYLWSRLGNRDLSQDEALALIGAVHHQLGQARAEDPRLYSSYSRFMESLNRQMPVVHDFVVAKWSESRYAGRRERRDGQDNLPEPEAEAELTDSQPAGAHVEPVQAVRSDQAAEELKGEEPQEPGEGGEDEEPETRDAAAESIKEGREAGDEAEQDNEPEDEAADEKEDAQEEETEEIEDSTKGEAAEEEGQETEDAESKNDESEQAESEESEGGEEPETEEESEPEESESPEPEGKGMETGEHGGEEEGELPEEEELEPPEPLEGEEGEEGVEGAEGAE